MTTPGTGRPLDLPPGGPGGKHGLAPPPRRRWWYAAALVAVLALVALATYAVISDDDPDAPSPPTTVAPTTTPTTGPAPEVEVDHTTAIWPAAGDPERFTDPVAAVRSFATVFLGFEAPVVGDFLAGDTRSGEVEVRPTADGPVTTVLVRQLTGADTWYVLGSATAAIEITSPTALTTIRSPVTVRGSAHAFEGTVQVEIRQDGTAGPIGAGFVTGGGDQMRPFEGTVGFDPPTARFGALVLLTRSAENGQVWEAAAIRVGLDGGEAEPVACDDYVVPRPLPAADQMEVTIYLQCDPGATGLAPLPVYRLVPSSPGVLRAALETLLAGPIEAESRAGLQSWFSAPTAGALLGVSLADGHAVVDLADLRSIIPNASTSAGSQQLLSQLDATVFRFPTVTSVEYRIDGSCETFTEWLQIGGCDPRTR